MAASGEARGFAVGGGDIAGFWGGAPSGVTGQSP